MQLQIESVQLSKSGKSYWVKASNGKGYTSRAQGIEQAATRTIEAVVGSVRLGNDDVPTITSFEFVEASRAAPAPVLSPSTPVDRWWLNFVSNQVHAAIAAGLVKDPEDMKKWAKGAYNAIFGADDIDF